MDAHKARNTTATVAFVKANRAFRPGGRGLHRLFFQRFFQTGMAACGCMLLAGLVSAQDADVSEADTMNAYVEPFSEAPAELDMIPVPAGSVSLHGEDVAVGPFWMSETEVPWDIFDIYAFGTDEDAGAGGSDDALLRPSKPYGAPDRGYGHRGYAAISMTYLVAESFAQWLSVRTGKTYRLPTEAEWEYACLADAPPVSAAELDEYAWRWDNAFDAAQPVGSLAPNAFGLYDMIGNAAEWCAGPEGAPLACGGSFMDKAEDVGCAARKTPSPKWQETDPQIPKSRFWLTDGPFMGFRVLREP